ncbi:DUF4422 domain-containing protein [Bartonella sp. HY406]|uniref:DUF4422 domain-containing protein n=1 Tax=Bartonella sp. HY406 TaxID=2979331 RepID=UPI0021C7D4F4|nr:DUF4422 domain-containing protein [Bartonella sp. HY406]UXN05124.1 DUF4422 domain-containing protein [Bartonella sp. HY406]
MNKIYVSYFSNTRILSNDVLTPIQCGRSLSKKKLNMIGDDTGDNISNLNKSYCEMTALYWAWKNDAKFDYIGFMHYRRFLDLHHEINRSNKTIHGIIVDKFDTNFTNNFGLNSNFINKFMKGKDGVLPDPFKVDSTVEEHYKNANYHHIKDFRIAERVVSDLYPDDIAYFKEMALGNIIYPCNIFIFKRSIFIEYCDWVFPILEELRKEIDLDEYNDQEKRVIGYLSERLFTTFILKKRATSPNVKFSEVPMVILTDTTPEPSGPEKPVTDMNVTSVVAASDQAYLPHIAALIHSVFDNSDKDAFIDFIVLDGGIRNEDRRALEHIPQIYNKHGRITFIDMSNQFLGVETHSYFAKPTFYRLLLPDILPNYDRVLFLDTDMIVISDITKLYNIDMKGKSVAAVPDLIMRTFTALGVKSIAESGGIPAKIYLSQYLNMGEKYNEYFQAGTILFNLKKMREKRYSTKMVEDLSDRKYWFLDQDVLNKNLLGDVLLISNEWNSVFLNEDTERFLIKEDIKIYKDSISNPSILHFAGLSKPWLNEEHPLSSYYWFYLRKTHWYEAVFIRYLDKLNSTVPHYKSTISPGPVSRTKNTKTSFYRRLWRALPRGMRRNIIIFIIKKYRKINPEVMSKYNIKSEF